MFSKFAQSLTDELQVAPSSFADIVKFVKEECDLYADNLPLSYSDDEAGHATKGAFLALKSRALLYLASPLLLRLHKPETPDTCLQTQQLLYFLPFFIVIVELIVERLSRGLRL